MGRSSTSNLRAQNKQLPNLPAKLPYIPVVIENQYVLAYLDTGAHISLVSADLWSNIPASQRSPVEKGTTGVSSVTGESVDITGTAKVILHLGNSRVQHKIHIARNINHQLILGWDFFCQHKAAVSPTTASFEMPGTSIPLTDSTRMTPLKGNAILVGEITIPPMSEINTQARIVNQLGITPHGYEGLFEPQLRDHHSVAAARSLCTVHHGHIIVRLINPSVDAKTLPDKTHLGQLHSTIGDEQEEYQIVDPVIASTSEPTTHLSTSDMLSSSELTGHQYQKVEQLLLSYTDIFSLTSDDIGQTDLAFHRIETSTDVPVQQRAYRTTPAMRVEIQRQVDDLLERNIIEESHSPWSSPIVMVKKKDNTMRFCIDYRKLNAITVRDSHPIPRQDDTLDALSGSAFFSVIDLSSGYWQVPLHPDDKEKTAFTTGTSLYHFNVMPFGLVNAPMTFQRLMEVALHGLHWAKCLIYLDDCIVIGKDFDEHLSNLAEVFERFRTAGLKLKPSKCQLLKKQVTYLGHTISTEGILPDPVNTDKVREWSTPTSASEVRSFLGLASYYRRFIPSFSQIAAPLNHLTQKKVPFEWSESCESSFQHLKMALINPPILAYPNFGQEFTLSTDASNNAIGAILSQNRDNKERVIAYFSASLTSTQQKWSTYDRELWAIIAGVRHFRHYLRGQHFTVITDHQPLLGHEKLPIQDDATGRRARWMVELHAYTFSIKHKQGRSHQNADALSRHPEHRQERDEAVPSPLTIAEPTCNVVETRSIKRSQNNSIDEPQQQESNSARSCEQKVYQTQPPALADMDLDLEKHQQQDKDISTLIDYIKSGHKPSTRQIRKHNPRMRRLLWQYPRLIMQNNILYRERTDKLGTTSLQLVVPESLVPRILQELHGHPASGHFGAQRTLQRAEAMCYWPFMHKEIMDYCNTCSACEAIRLPSPQHKAPLQPISSSYPLQMVFADIAELPTSKRGFRYILVVVDHFSKYVNIYAMRDQTAQTVAKHLFEDFIKEHGIPDTLHTDQGRQFESRLVHELCQKLGIRKSRSSPYHPQGAGIVERSNRTIKDQLAKYVTDQGGEWDTHIHQLQLAYNTSVHATTGLTPYFVMHGREARMPANITCSVPTPTFPSPMEYVTDLTSRLRKAIEYINKNCKSAQRRQKECYDTKTKLIRYNTGDLVWLHDPTTSRNKLDPNWKGPFSILSSSDDGLNYRIVDIHDDRNRKLVHHNRLKMFRARMPNTKNGQYPKHLPLPQKDDRSEQTAFPPYHQPFPTKRGKIRTPYLPQSHFHPTSDPVNPAFIDWSPTPGDQTPHQPDHQTQLEDAQHHLGRNQPLQADNQLQLEQAHQPAMSHQPSQPNAQLQSDHLPEQHQDLNSQSTRLDGSHQTCQSTQPGPAISQADREPDGEAEGSNHQPQSGEPLPQPDHTRQTSISNPEQNQVQPAQRTPNESSADLSWRQQPPGPPADDNQEAESDRNSQVNKNSRLGNQSRYGRTIKFPSNFNNYRV